MGQLTRAQIVSEGLLLAGNDSLTLRANVWLNIWLKKQYAAWPWPFLHERAGSILLPAGSTSLLVGAGNASVSHFLRRILDPIGVYSVTPLRSTVARARIRQWTGGPIEQDQTLMDPTTARGVPSTFKLQQSTTVFGAWTLIPSPFPDKDYYLSLDYIQTPSDIDATSGGDSVVPGYPNDETLVCCVTAYALQWMKQDEAPAKMQELAGRAVNDRTSYGSVEGINDLLSLDGGVFK